MNHIMINVVFRYTAQPFTLRQVPHTLERAFYHAYQGRPGAAYVDLVGI
jgi:thiamine pyrophosphate-dependent acetolactate synthase large subunit-like protein